MSRLYRLADRDWSALYRKHGVRWVVAPPTGRQTETAVWIVQKAWCGVSGGATYSLLSAHVSSTGKTTARLVLRKLHFWLYGPCDPDSGALKADIVGAILRLMEDDG